MENNENLFDELKSRDSRRFKQVYRKKESGMIKNRDVSLYKSTDDLIKVRVDEISKEMAYKYKIEEHKVHDSLYLKVRKMFLELL
ncbi:MAG: hypothetical protein U9Q33_12580 [Campylobacterota bacterium]|nr:hypothetical protein [Campylobacterota bacterium]